MRESASCLKSKTWQCYAKEYSNFSSEGPGHPFHHIYANWLQHLFTSHVFLFFFQTCFDIFFGGGVCCISQTTFLALPPFPRRLFMVEHGGNSNARQSHRSAPHRRSASVRVVDFQYHLTIRRKTPGGVLMGVDGWKTPLQILFKYNTYGVCDIKHLHGKMKKLNGNLVYVRVFHFRITNVNRVIFHDPTFSNAVDPPSLTSCIAKSCWTWEIEIWC